MNISIRKDCGLEIVFLGIVFLLFQIKENLGHCCRNRDSDSVQGNRIKKKRGKEGEKIIKAV